MAIVWSKDAADELLEIAGFLKYNAGTTTARNVYLQIKTKIERISHTPKAGKIVPELAAIGIEHIYQLAENPWKIYYRPEGKNIYVLSVLDSRRDLEEILYSKFLDGKIV
jgi:toxin ParE1/3/4